MYELYLFEGGTNPSQYNSNTQDKVEIPLIAIINLL